MGLSVWHVVLVLVVVLILFGAGKLPRVMGDVAKGIKNFRTGLAEIGFRRCFGVAHIFCLKRHLRIRSFGVVHVSSTPG